MSPVKLGIIIGVIFSSLLVFRPWLKRYYIESAPKQHQAPKALILDFTICAIAGIIINTFNHLAFGIPLVNLISLMTGAVIAGFFIALDSSLAQEREVILKTAQPELKSALPRRLFPMTHKFSIVAIIVTFFVALVLAMVFARDVEWLTGINLDEHSIQEAQLSVISEIFFIMAILMVLIGNLIFSFSRNIRLLFNNETKILERVSQGDLSAKVPVATQDEFGLIAEYTNNMIDGLRHRFELISSLKLAEKVQQNLLPSHSPILENFDISGSSVYCDETGGDYYDYFLLPENRLGVVVADACGHGVSAAMLMTSVRAFLTYAITNYKNPAALLNDINVHITRDCAKDSSFTTLFFAEFNPKKRSVKWVRAGHEPALLFNAQTQLFSRLDAKGLVLGVDDTYQYKNSTTGNLSPGDIILIGTDGISETRNNKGQTFGTERLETVIAKNGHQPSRIIQNAIIDDITLFRGDSEQEDDITLVAIKAI